MPSYLEDELINMHLCDDGTSFSNRWGKYYQTQVFRTVEYLCLGILHGRDRHRKRRRVAFSYLCVCSFNDRRHRVWTLPQLKRDEAWTRTEEDANSISTKLSPRMLIFLAANYYRGFTIITNTIWQIRLLGGFLRDLGPGSSHLMPITVDSDLARIELEDPPA